MEQANSILYVIKILNKTNQKIINNIISSERKLNLSKVKTFKNFFKIINKSKIELNNFLKKQN